MPSLQQKRRSYLKKYCKSGNNDFKKRQYNKQYYILHAEKIKAEARALYRADPKKKNIADCTLYRVHCEERKALARDLYKIDPDKKKATVHALYEADPEKKKARARTLYERDPDKRKAVARDLYKKDPDKKKAAARDLYKKNPDRKKAAARDSYKRDPEKKKIAARALYRNDPRKKKAASRIYFARNHTARLKSYRKYHCCHKREICLKKMARYSLAHPRPTVVEMHCKCIQFKLLSDCEAKLKLEKAFRAINDVYSPRQACVCV